MYKRLTAGVVAVLLPYLIFSFVIKLNDSDLDLDKLRRSSTQFDVERKKSVPKPPPQQQKKQESRQQSENLPQISPADVDGSLSEFGLDFGIPAMNQTGFDELGDNDLLSGSADSPMDKGSVDVPPKVIRRTPIVYPELARQQGVSGYVTMNVLIDEEGNVEDVRIIESKPEEIFDLKADSTIRMWKFSPASYDGKTVKVWATQRIVFKLE
jgi:protein TonB